MRERLPERARNPTVVRAVTSPGSILLAGVGASAAILAGVPLATAAVVGGLVWAGRVARAVSRRSRRVEIIATMVKEPWRSLVRQAQRAESRFAQVLSTTAPGPLKDRLAQVDSRVTVGVDECWRIAQRGNQLSAAVADLNVDDLHAQLERTEAQASRDPERGDLPGTAAAIRQQLATAARLAGVARDAEDRLRRLAAQLNEAVARAVELSLQDLDAGTLHPLGGDVDRLVGELESLRVALEETTR